MGIYSCTYGLYYAHHVYNPIKGAGIEIPIVSSAFKQLHEASSTFLADALAGLDAQLEQACGAFTKAHHDGTH